MDFGDFHIFTRCSIVAGQGWFCEVSLSIFSAERLCIFGLHGAIYINFLLTSFYLPFSEVSLVALAIDVVE